MPTAIFMLGLLITIGGVGGVEHSLNDMDMLIAASLSFLGLVFMGVSVPYLTQE
jgi:hypothetical protein